MSIVADSENWVLFQSRYDYMAIPASLAVEVMKSMKVMDSAHNLSKSSDINIKMINAEQMTVAIAKYKMLPEEPDK